LKTKASTAVLKELLSKFQVLTSKANPTASLWASRGALERALGDKAAAKTSLNRAIVIEPKNKPALMERAEIALSEGDYTNATEIAKTLFKLRPNQPTLRFCRREFTPLKAKSPTR
jgi:predicted Zn-dependent protease